MDELPEPGDPQDDHDANLLLDELRQAVREAFSKISPKCQRLLRLLTGDPPMPYRDIADHLEMPIGSIGATRQRCLDKLRSEQAMQSYLAGGER